MSNGSRRHFTPQQKAEIVRRHLSGKKAVSDLASEFQIQPSQIHGWVKLVLDQAGRPSGGSPATGGATRPKSVALPNWKKSWYRRTRSSRS